MPLYDYACAQCGRFSARHPLSEFDRPTACPQCGTASPRALSVPAVLGRSARESAPTDAAGYRRLRRAGGCGCCAV